MRVIIAGPRDCNDWNLLMQALENWPFEEIAEVVSGKAKGVDTMGEKWAKQNKLPITEFPAAWKEIEVEGAKIVEGPYGPYNSLAGVWRNRDMAEYADALLAIDLGTDGTANMIDTMKKLGKPVFVWPYKEPNVFDRVYQF